MAQVQFAAPRGPMHSCGSSQLAVTVPEDLMPFASHLRHQTCTQCAGIQTGRTFIHTTQIDKLT